MTTLLPLALGTEASPWTTYLGVGIGGAALGGLVFALDRGLGHPASGLGDAAFLLSLFVVGLGVVTALESLWVRRIQDRASAAAP